MRTTGSILLLSLSLVLACESEQPAGQRGTPPSGTLPPRVEGPRVAEVDIPSEPPFVGEPGVDAFGNPRQRPDQIALLNLLRLRRFDVLDRFVTHYQDEFEADHRREYWPRAALSAFEVGDPEVGERIDEWVRLMPESFAAVAARGSHRLGVGRHYRGGATIGKTSRGQIEAMDAQLVAAIADFEQALKMRPKLVAARTNLLRIANLRGPEAQERVQLDAALAECPTCYTPRQAYLIALTPRWGGSYERMQAYLDEIAPLVASSPRLGLLAGMIPDDQCRSLAEAGKLAEAHVACDAALGFEGEATYLVGKAGLHARAKDYAAALPFLDRALAIAPQDDTALANRYFARLETKDVLGAARDLIDLRHLDPSAPNLGAKVEHMVGKLRYEGQELHEAGKYLEAADYFALGLQLAPDDRDMANRQAWNQKSIGFDDAKKQLAAAPDDFALHLRVDHGLAASSRFAEVVEMWDGFIAAHPTDPRPFVERGGAKWHLGQHDDAIADMRNACRLGMQTACDDVEKMKSRKPRG
ncbi:hypothetical protein ACNOYE_18090 [Nannocystaceae bacterium ST9]